MADELKELEKRISKEYTKATAELKKKADDYFDHYKERWKKEYDAFQAGKYTAQEFKAWEQAQLGRGDHWIDMRDQMANRMVMSKQIASNMINGVLPIAYAKASNSTASLVRASAMDQGIMGIRFDLVDAKTVELLMLNQRNFSEFRVTSVDPIRDYKWNRDRIQNALLQGILQGDSIDDFTRRFLDVMENNRKSAIRNARTAVTSARNAGRQSRWEALAEQGCEITKVWSTAGDDRVRDAHADADGQEVPYDEPFIVGGEELMYPADPVGSGWNVYNCRCQTATGSIKFHSILSEEQRRRANIRFV